jgi:MFS family permease
MSDGVAPAARRARDFWTFFTGQTISNLGTSFTLFALPLLVFQLTKSPLNLAIATAADMLPYLLFGLLIGAWVDRVNRKRLMILTDLTRAAVIATIPLMASLGHLTVVWIYGVAFVHATLGIFFNSAEFAAIPSLVSMDDLVAANGRVQASYSAAQVAGPLLAGVLVVLVPLPALMLFDAASFLLSVFSLTLIRTSFNQAETTGERKHILRDVVDGLRYVVRHPVLRNISAMMALVNFVGVTTAAQLVFFARTQLHASYSQVAWLYSAGSVGVVVMGLLAGVFRKRWSFSQVALGALMVSGLLTVAFALTPIYWVGLVLWGLTVGLGILFNINTGSLRQAIVPNHMLGRVISIASVLAWSAIPLGSLLGGYAIQQTHNVVLVYVVIGVLTFLIPLMFSFTALGHAERYLPKPEPQAVEEAAPAAP